jgi:hypothetical protein
MLFDLSIIRDCNARDHPRLIRSMTPAVLPPVISEQSQASDHPCVLRQSVEISSITRAFHFSTRNTRGLPPVARRTPKHPIDPPRRDPSGSVSS